MNVTFAPRGIVQIDDCKICYRNFAGEAIGKFNKKGDRNFAVIIPNNDIADQLMKDEWNVKIKAPREEGDDPFMYLNVKVNFNQYGPIIYLRNGKNRVRITEDTAHMLDSISIDHVDLDIAPSFYDKEELGKGTGKAAYLRSMEIFQLVDRFEERYQAEVNSDDIPF